MTAAAMRGREPCAKDAAPLCVAIVDDNVQYAENIAEIVAIGGCVSAIFPSAEAALPAALTPDVDGLIVDYRLPGMTGLELIAQVLRERPVPAVVMSAYLEDDVLDAARALGAEILPKPIDIAHLNRIVSGLARHVV